MSTRPVTRGSSAAASSSNVSSSLISPPPPAARTIPGVNPFAAGTTTTTTAHTRDKASSNEGTYGLPNPNEIDPLQLPTQPVQGLSQWPSRSDKDTHGPRVVSDDATITPSLRNHYGPGTTSSPSAGAPAPAVAQDDSRASSSPSMSRGEEGDVANGGSGFGFDGHKRRNGKDGIASNNGSMRRSNRRKARPSPLRKGARAEDASSASGENDGQEAGEPGALGENEEEGGDAWEGGFSASSDEEDDEEGDPTHVVGRSPSKKSKLSVTKKQTRPAARKGKGRAAERDHAETNGSITTSAFFSGPGRERKRDAPTVEDTPDDMRALSPSVSRGTSGKGKETSGAQTRSLSPESRMQRVANRFISEGAEATENGSRITSSTSTSNSAPPSVATRSVSPKVTTGGLAEPAAPPHPQDDLAEDGQTQESRNGSQPEPASAKKPGRRRGRPAKEKAKEEGQGKVTTMMTRSKGRPQSVSRSRGSSIPGRSYGRKKLDPRFIENERIHSRINATLDVELDLIRNSAHPLQPIVLENLDKMKAQRIARAKHRMDTRIQSLAQTFQAGEELIWNVWADKKRDLRSKLLRENERKRWSLKFEGEDWDPSDGIIQSRGVPLPQSPGLFPWIQQQLEAGENADGISTRGPASVLRRPPRTFTSSGGLSKDEVQDDLIRMKGGAPPVAYQDKGKGKESAVRQGAYEDPTPTPTPVAPPVPHFERQTSPIYVPSDEEVEPPPVSSRPHQSFHVPAREPQVESWYGRAPHAASTSKAHPYSDQGHHAPPAAPDWSSQAHYVDAYSAADPYRHPTTSYDPYRAADPGASWSYTNAGPVDVRQPPSHYQYPPSHYPQSPPYASQYGSYATNRLGPDGHGHGHSSYATSYPGPPPSVYRAPSPLPLPPPPPPPQQYHYPQTPAYQTTYQQMPYANVHSYPASATGGYESRNGIESIPIPAKRRNVDDPKGPGASSTTAKKRKVMHGHADSRHDGVGTNANGGIAAHENSTSYRPSAGFGPADLKAAWSNQTNVRPPFEVSDGAGQRWI